MTRPLDVFSSASAVRTTTKVRVLAGQIHSTRQQVLRIDYEGQPLADDELRARLHTRMMEEISTADAVIISDYNYGLADGLMVEAIREATRERNIPVIVDSRFGLARYTGFASATPNEDDLSPAKAFRHSAARCWLPDRVLP